MTRTTVYLEFRSVKHNKFYKMEDNGDGTWIATYGKIGTKGCTKIYSSYRWASKLDEKLKKGYKETKTQVKMINNDHLKKVNKLIECIRKCDKAGGLKSRLLPSNAWSKVLGCRFQLETGNDLSAIQMEELNDIFRIIKKYVVIGD